MGFFERKIVDKSLLERIVALETELKGLKLQMNTLELQNKDLIDKVLRKIQKQKTTESEGLYSGMFLPS